MGGSPFSEPPLGDDGERDTPEKKGRGMVSLQSTESAGESDDNVIHPSWQEGAQSDCHAGCGSM